MNELETWINHSITCEYFIDQKDSNGEIAICYCTHSDNRTEYEGNCTPDLCPIKELRCS